MIRRFALPVVLVLAIGVVFVFIIRDEKEQSSIQEATPPVLPSDAPVVTLPPIAPTPSTPIVNPPAPPPPVTPPPDPPPVVPPPPADEPPPVNPPPTDEPSLPPPPEPTPPTPYLSGNGGDSVIALTYSTTAGTENKLPFSYTLIAAYDVSLLESIASENFSTPPLGAAVVPLTLSTPGSLFIGDVLNNQTVFFRVRACDASIPAHCAATSAVGVTPKLQKITASLGAPETVFDWTTDRCDDLDLPDSNARAVRLVDGSLFFIAANGPQAFRMTGADFDHLERNCSTPILVSKKNQDPAQFENWEWVWSVYRIGSKIHALIHNEYHDASASVCKVGETGPGNPCWWNSITAAYSTDGGASFTRYDLPFRVVAALPNPWNPDVLGGTTPNVHGYLTPSNIVKHADGYYYAFLDSDTSPTLNAAQAGGSCIMRTPDLGSPDNWRAWDGASFSIRMDPPYTYPSLSPQSTGKPFCKPVATVVAPGFDVVSITYNTYLGKYLAVGYGKFKPADSVVCGFYLSTSSNLTHWSEPQLTLAGNFPIGGACPSKNELVETYSYPSLIDHDAPDTNFETSGETAYLYYVINHGGLDRDLVRRTITLTK